MDRDLHNNIPPISDLGTHSTSCQVNQKKGRKKQKENYNEKFLIKRVKTRCLKIYFRLILECIGSQVAKVNEKRNIFKLFKSDVCKSRNRAILYQSMRHLVDLFSNFKLEGVDVKKDRLTTFNYLMGLNWEDFILHVKHKGIEFFSLENSDPVVLLSEISEFFAYIKSETKYKPRSIDVNYATLYELLEDGRKGGNYDNDCVQYIQNFKDL
jgi:hypothetical protein